MYFHGKMPNLKPHLSFIASSMLVKNTDYPLSHASLYNISCCLSINYEWQGCN